MKSRKGGYKLVSLQFGELTTMTALAGLHASIENSHDKPLLISDIVINGERKNNAFAIAEKDGDAYIIKGVYGYDIKVNANDEIECEPIDDRDVTLEVTDIKALTKKQCEQLKCGDKVLKKTGNQKHLYVVTYKEHHVGMCLSYVDASVVETQSYDYTGSTWVYNSEDKTPLINIEGAESGTIVDALGLNGEGKLVKGTISGGTKLYKHYVKFSNTDVYFYTNDPTQLTATSMLYNRCISSSNIGRCIVKVSNTLYDVCGILQFLGGGFSDYILIYFNGTRESSSSFTLTPTYVKLGAFTSDTVTEL